MCADNESKVKVNPGLPAVLSFIFSGLGQIYNGQIGKGLKIMTFSCLGMFLVIVGAILILHPIFTKTNWTLELVVGIAFSLLGILLISILGVYAIYDAYRVAKGGL